MKEQYENRLSISGINLYLQQKQKSDNEECLNELIDEYESMGISADAWCVVEFRVMIDNYPVIPSFGVAEIDGKLYVVDITELIS